MPSISVVGVGGHSDDDRQRCDPVVMERMLNIFYAEPEALPPKGQIVRYLDEYNPGGVTTIGWQRPWKLRWEPK